MDGIRFLTMELGEGKMRAPGVTRARLPAQSKTDLLP